MIYEFSNIFQILKLEYDMIHLHW